MIAVSNVWRRSFRHLQCDVASLGLQAPLVVSSSRIATGLGALVTLRVAKPISLGVEKSVQRLLNRAANNSVQVPPDPLVVDRDDIRQRNRPILVSHGGFVPLSRL